MKKTITIRKEKRQQDCPKEAVEERPSLGWTVGVDLGDRDSHYCILNEGGEVVSRGEVATTKTGFGSQFREMPRSRVVLEVGTHSPWVSRQLRMLGHEVIVANPHRVKLIARSKRKNDRIDAEQLARLGRADVKLLYPIRHRGEAAQADLAVIRARDVVVKARTKLITAARGLTKSFGERLKPCDPDQVTEKLAAGLGVEVNHAVGGLLRAVSEMTKEIGTYDRQIREMEERYPEVKLLKQVHGVGTLVALGFVLTIDDAERFVHSRDVGAMLGLVPGQRDSGAHEGQMAITKAGDRLVRSLLVQAAHCVLREGAPDSDLKSWAVARAGQGGKRGKKRVVVAVARKLAVLLHHLWVSGEVYDPQYNRKLRGSRTAAA